MLLLRRIYVSTFVTEYFNVRTNLIGYKKYFFHNLQVFVLKCTYIIYYIPKYIIC